MKNLLFSAFLFCFVGSVNIAQAEFFNFCNEEKGPEVPVAAPLADNLSTTLKKLPDTRKALEKIELINGIRAMDGEIATPGEVKILVNLNWQALPEKPSQRQAQDNTAAKIISAVFSDYAEITKLRVIVRTKNEEGKYRATAKVFSFTRATWELTKNNSHYDVNTTTGIVNLLSLGDYVVLTDKGWIRGY